MPARIVTILLVLGLLYGGAILFEQLGSLHLPGNQQDYEPLQSVAFSHRLHAGELSVSCLYCHAGAEKSRQAGIPAANICMNCHKAVTARLGVIRDEETRAKAEGRQVRRVVSPELRKLYDSLALDEQLQPRTGQETHSIEWLRVHNLPAHAFFDHRSHLSAGLDCRACHGPVENMERVRQVERLSMGWCVNCHRDAARTGVAGKAVQPSLDCAACHR